MRTDGYIVPPERRTGRATRRQAIYVIDRFDEVFAVYRAAEGQAMPSAWEIVEWLSFINSQCPE